MKLNNNLLLHFKRIIQIAFLTLAIFLCNTSCQNVFETVGENSDSEETVQPSTKKPAKGNDGETASKTPVSTPEAQKKKYIDLKGDIDLSGAYPISVKEKIENNDTQNLLPEEAVETTPSENEDENGNGNGNDNDRSALPSIPTDGSTEYYIKATAQGHDAIEGNVEDDRTYTIKNLELGVEWTLEAGIRYIDHPEKVLMMDKTSRTFYEDDLVDTFNFTLKPLSTGGNGEIFLQMTLPTGGNVSIQKVTATCVSEDSDLKAAWNAVNHNVTISDNTAKLNISAIKSGCYDIIFSFYDDEDTRFSLYSTLQSVNVFENMKTDSWADGGNVGVIKADGTFELTSDLLKKYSLTHIYVGDPGTGKEAKSTNSGGPYAPLDSIDSAINLIAAQKVAANHYTIHVSRTQTGHFSLDSRVTGNAASITLVGQNVSNANNQPIPAVLDGENGSGSVLKVETAVPVTIQNLTITRGNANGNGGGICAATGSNVTIANGTNITDNHASGFGGGIYIETGATVSMNGGTISNNTATVKGGAVYNEATFKIKGDSSIPYDNTHPNDVYLADGKTVTISGAITNTSSKIATITIDTWERGTAILDAASESIMSTYASKFSVTEPGFKIQKNKHLTTEGIIDSPIWVKTSDVPEAEQTGTSNKPFSTVSQALAALTADYNEIYVSGEVTGNQEITNPPIDFTLCGEEGASATLNGGGSGTVLTVNIGNSKTVTIKNLKITGGTGTSEGNSTVGGGIKITRGIVKLDDGAHITKNYADYGGGVYVSEYGTMYMYGSSVIGDTGFNSCPNNNATASNSGHVGAGVYSYGKVFIGYDNWTSDSDYSLRPMTEGYGVCHNWNNNSAGGGIYIISGKLRMASGTIEYNSAEQLDGGGIGASSNSDIILSGGTIKNNFSKRNGGALYITSDFTLKDSVSIPYGVNGENGAGKNDVYIANDKTINIGGNLTNHDDINKIYLTPQKWTRGRQVLSGSFTSGNYSKFATTDPEFSVSTSAANSAVINADIIVAVNTNSSYDATTARGTKSDPYKTIADALSNAVNANATTIKIKGTVTGAQTIASVDVPDGVSSITLEGYKASGESISTAKLNGGFTSSSKGTTLTVNKSGFDVTIKDLTISGGYASSNGGGINIAAGTVKLADGAKITENIASEYGGGVYVAGSDSNLFMSGSSIIGDTDTNIAQDGTTSTSTTFANKAVKSGGGIYNNGGAVYIGYSGLSSGTPQKSDMTSGGGVRRNYAGNSNTTSGGGILNRSGTLTIASGSISYNRHYNHGGGIYIADGEVNIEAPATAANKAVFNKNKALVGGAIYNGKKLTMKAGQIGGSGVQNTVEGTDARGGAIYQGGTFEISGSAVVYAGSEKTNDIFLPKPNGTNTLTVTVGSLSNSGTIATITPEEYKRGTKILSSTSVLTAAAKNQFKLAKDDTGWDRDDDTSASIKYVYITSPIYVASSGTDSTRKVCSAAPASGNNGTKTSPYASIEAALSDSDLSKVDYTITIDGKLNAQTISSTATVAGSATAITLHGYKTSSTAASSAQINGGGTATALSLAKSGLTTTIQDLTITNGNATNGGGINISAGTVKLTDGAKIYGNTASSNGGGVYVGSSGTLFMYGSGLIGYDSTTNGVPTSATLGTSSGKAANSANLGGGIYNAGNVYIGYSASGTPSGLTTNYGIRQNYASSSGGGIYCKGGTVTVGTGYVSYNASASSGGAFFISDAGTYNINSGSVISGNKSVDGGAFYIINTGLKINGGTISNNIATAKGGAVYATTNTGSFEISDGTFSANEAQGETGGGGAVYLLMPTLTLKGGTFTGNKATGASGKGGAIYNAGTLTMSAGTIGSSTTSSQNKVTGTSGLGGAIYQGGTFNVSGSAKVLPGSEKTNDVYLNGSNTVSITASYTGSGNDGSSKMTLTPSAWTRGKTVLNGTSLTTTNAGYFSIADTEWSVLTDSTNYGKIDAPLYVSASGNDTTGRGTSSLPYKTIKTAVAQCWGGTLDNTATTGRVINIVGTLSGVSQEVPDTVTSSEALAITLKGTSTSAAIDRGLTSGNASSDGSALTINTSVPVRIQQLIIKGGNKTGNGGGINITNTSAKVATLSGTKVMINKASGNGGGIYVPAGATLCLSDTTYIGKSGGSLPASTSTNPTADNGINKAANGGGIYCAGNIKFGKTYNGTTLANGVDFKGAIIANIATTNGGGLYLASGASYELYTASTVTMIEYNYAGNGGGGIYNAAGADGSPISIKSTYPWGNKATYGGGIYNNGYLKLLGGNQIGSSGTNVNTATSAGGGLYCGKTVEISGTTTFSTTSLKTNDVYAPSASATIKFTSDSWSGSLLLTPGSYDTTSQYVKGTYSSYVTKLYSKVSITPDSNGTKWITTSAGKLTKGARVTAANAAAAVASLPAGGTLELSGNPSADQLKAIRDELLKLSETANITLDLSNTTIVNIPANSFYDSEKGGCAALTSVKLPTTVTSIGDNAFRGSSISSITGTGNVTSYGKYAFSSTKLTSYTFPSGTTAIPDGLFWHTNLSGGVNIPDTVTTIGKEAFSCSYLPSINSSSSIPSSVTTIGDSAFNYCSFTTLTIPNTVTSLDQYCFANNHSLTSVTLPYNTSVTKIPDYAFVRCDKLTTVNYSSNITEIGTQAFCECSALTSFTVKSSVKKIGANFLWQDGAITSLTFQVTSGWKEKNGTVITSMDPYFASQSTLLSALVGTLGEYGYSTGNNMPWYRE